jgi:hypothetical protein
MEPDSRPASIVHRRGFLKTAATAVAMPYLVPATVFGAPGRPGANDRIQVGLIGTGYPDRTSLRSTR